MSRKFKLGHSSFIRSIVLIVIIGMAIMAFAISAVVLVMSKSVFRENYADSQEKVLDRIEKEYYDFHNDLQDVFNAIDSSWAFRLYLTEEEELDNVDNFQNIYEMEKDLENEKTAAMERLNIMVVGMKGKHYLARTETITVSDEEIFESEAVKAAIAQPEQIHYTYSYGAYTATSKDSNVIIVSKALCYQNSDEVYAIVLVTLTMEDMRQYFDYFVNENSNLYIVGQEDIVISSSEENYIGKMLDDKWYLQAKNSDESRCLVDGKGNYTVMKYEMPYMRCFMYGVLDDNIAMDRLYNIPQLMLVCTIIGAVIIVLCVVAARQVVNPLTKLVKMMSKIREENFDQYMPVEGTKEVQELAITYNIMLKDIQGYIDEMLKMQKKQRRAEIKALQMQINPHYIYNTLASIKWLIYRNENEKAIQTIDAFISLLRSSISNMDEYISVEQEVENIKNYIYINQIRYGDAVKVEYYISHNCNDCLLPKLIVQPFIENAFFHAFPAGRFGIIQIFMNTKGDNLEICIVDDGIGMAQAKLGEVFKKKKEHFSGIGIHNVHDRLKLLYGEDYGVEIDSAEKSGTTVIITLPINKKQENGGRL